ncbi:MAG: amidohydrolase [Syntrophobacterales bacterium]|jgi:5-methylthioadenosine/S-adenosylhomocysteine deaminase
MDQGTEINTPVDLLIHNAKVLTLNDSDEIFDPGVVAITNDEIVWVGPETSWPDQIEPWERLNMAGGLIMPGLINAHTHAAMTCFRGLADDLPLSVWLNEHIFPAERNINGELVYKGTLLACAEMILGGITTFCDMYLFEDQVAKAAHEASMRALVGEVLYDFPSPNYGPPEQGLAFTRDLIQTWQVDPLISVAVEPHAVYTCSPDLLYACRDIAEDFRVPMIIHLSESQDEVNQVKERYGLSPVDHLEKLELLSPRLIADHCVVLTEEEMDILAERGVRVVHNNESNMKLANGVAPVAKLLERGVVVGLGTDGCASNNNLDMLAEMDSVAKLHKVYRMDPTIMDAKTVVRLATRGGARVLGLDEQIGSLEPGKKADLIGLDLDKPHLTPLYNIYSHVVYAASAADVTLNIINGRVVMRDGELLTLDVEKVMAEVRAIAKKIKS